MPIDRLSFEIARQVYWNLYSEFIKWGASTEVWLGIPLVFVVEGILPAQRYQANIGVLQDVIYLVVSKLSRAVLLALYMVFLKNVFDALLGWTTVDLALKWGPYKAAFLAWLIADFLGWLQHIVRHKVPVFWAFHTVHHSQTRLNTFTRERGHPLDLLTAYTIKFIPFLWLQLSLDLSIVYIGFSAFLDTANHSNIRTNCGFLRYIFVTPQSHRIHHSYRPQHIDKNFGVTLCIWDRLFGTHYENADEYPETGIVEADFPIEKVGRTRLSDLTRQLAYPFRLAADTLRPR